MRKSVVMIIICGGAVLAALSAILLTRLQFSYDLAVFLPPPQSNAEQVLTESLGRGPGSRYLIIALHNADSGQLELARQALQAEQEVFSSVRSAASIAAQTDIPPLIRQYRYLLSDTDWSEAALAQTLKQRAAEMALFGGDEFIELLRSDPLHKTLDILDGILAGRNFSDDWISADGARLLVAESNSQAFDIGAQKQAVRVIKDTLQQLPELQTVTLELAGVGVISTELEQTIRQEAQQRSIVAGIALALLLWLAYRRWSLLLLAAVPLLSGALFGLAAVALLFGRVHGITLAFGFTLLGVAIDYPLHVFSHSRRRPAGIAIRAIWPTLRLGVLSTVAAYIALAVSGSSGLSQLGVFTSTGLITAALVTRYLLPPLLSRRVVMPIAGADHPPAGSLSIRLRGWPPALAVLLVLLVLIGLAAATGLRRPLWDNDLASLSPVAKTRATREGELRAILGTPDLRHVIAIRAANLEQALQASEQLDRQLAEAAASGWLSDWQVITRLLPSAASQQRRRAALPSVPQLHAEIEQSIAATPFVADAFAPFEQAVAASRELPLLDLEKIRASEFAAFADSHLYQTPDSWVSIISLYHLQQPGQLQNWLKQYPQAQLVDFKQAANDLVADYRSRLLEILLGAGVVVMILLLWRLQMRRAVWCMATVGSAVLTTAGIVYAAGGPLNLYHLVALLLVFGLGLDYALFASDEYQAREEYRDTLHAILSCAASTFIVFAILGFSAIPALHALGGTIAVGTALCLLLALTGVRRIAA